MHISPIHTLSFSLFLLGKVGSQIVTPYRGDQYWIRDLKVAGDLGQVIQLVCITSPSILFPLKQTKSHSPTLYINFKAQPYFP